jgi:predicted metalloprotease with PDZ domain
MVPMNGKILAVIHAAAAALTTCVAEAQCLTIRPDLTRVNGPASHAAEVQSLCGWIGVQVSPMTSAFAASLGMVEPYGAIFDQPEPGSPAAKAGIEQGDVITAINGSALKGASDFVAIISAMGPGSMIYLSTFRNGEMIEVRLVLGSSICGKSGTTQPSSWRDPIHPMSRLSADLSSGRKWK